MSHDRVGPITEFFKIHFLVAMLRLPSRVLALLEIPRPQTLGRRASNSRRFEMIRKIIATLFVLAISVGAAAAQSCNNYPNVLTNGQPADANQVMANFNYVANCVNTL